MIFEGDFAAFWKLVKFGELVHVGHGATFGLDKYRIVAAECAQYQRPS